MKGKNSNKFQFEKHLNQKFPEIPAPFPALCWKSVASGQNLQNLSIEVEKFAVVGGSRESPVLIGR